MTQSSVDIESRVSIRTDLCRRARLLKVQRVTAVTQNFSASSRNFYMRERSANEQIDGFFP
jgi:hypothetical protein